MTRYDVPMAARFTQPDTIVPGGGGAPQLINRYAYVSNNPLKYNDPTGRCLAGVGPLTDQQLAGCNSLFRGELQSNGGPSAAEAGALASPNRAVFDYYWASHVQNSIAQITGGCLPGDFFCTTAFDSGGDHALWLDWQDRVNAATECRTYSNGCETVNAWLIGFCLRSPGGCANDGLRTLLQITTTGVAVACIASTSGVCSGLVLTLGAVNTGVAVNDARKGRCSAWHAVLTGTMSFGPWAAVNRTTDLAQDAGMQAFNAVVHNGSGLAATPLADMSC